MKKIPQLAGAIGSGKNMGRSIPFEVTTAQARAMGLDVDALEAQAEELEFSDVGGAPIDELKEMMREVEAKFRRKEPIFREAARFRERTAQVFTGLPTPDWFSELHANPAFKRFAGTNPDTHSALMTWVVMKLRQCSASSNWFRLSEALAYKLAATDLKGAVCGDLKLPMEAFYIEVPPKMLYIEDQTHRRTGWHEVRTLTVTKGAITEKTLDVARAQGDPTADHTLVGPRLLVECYAEPNENSRDPFDDSWFFLSYRLLEDNISVEEVLDDMRMKARPGEHFSRMKIGEHVLPPDEPRIFLMKFILNFCIYLGSDRASVKHQHEEEIKKILEGKKRKNLRGSVRSKLERLENDRVFLVGTDVTVDDEVKQYVRLGETGYYKLTYRTLVRGHWREQAWGPRHSLRRSKWIEPHVRGKDLPTKVVGHNYEVK